MPHVGEFQVRSQPQFIAPALLNSWADFGGAYTPCGYYKDELGFVHLRGVLTGGTLIAPIFVLPVGFRPAFQELHLVASNASFANVEIYTNGNVQLNSGSNVYCSLDGITFKAL